MRSSYTAGLWVVYATRLRRAGEPAGSPSTVTVPDATTWVPTIARMSVDLPLPLGPRSPVTVPARDLERDPVERVAPAPDDVEPVDLDGMRPRHPSVLTQTTP